MARAPRPGKTRKNQEARRTITIRIGEHEPVTLAPDNVSMGEKMVVRKALGLPLDNFLIDDDRMGEDSIAVLWWLARRANGEPFLTWTQAMNDWPNPLTADAIDVEMDDGQGDDELDPETGEPIKKDAHPEG
jgi:hypothetical protein